MYCRDTGPRHLVVLVGVFPRAFLVIRPKQLDPRVLRLSTICYDWFGVLTPRALLFSLQIISELGQTADRLGSAGNGACLLHSCSKPPYDHKESKPRSSVSPSRTCISCRRQCHRPCWPCVCQSMPLAGPYELANQRKLSGCHQEIQLSCTNRRTRGLSP